MIWGIETDDEMAARIKKQAAMLLVETMGDFLSWQVTTAFNAAVKRHEQRCGILELHHKMAPSENFTWLTGVATRLRKRWIEDGMPTDLSKSRLPGRSYHEQKRLRDEYLARKGITYAVPGLDQHHRTGGAAFDEGLPF